MIITSINAVRLGRDDYPIYQGKLYKDAKVILGIELINGAKVNYEFLVKANTNVFEAIISELNKRNICYDFMEGTAQVIGEKTDTVNNTFYISYRDKWIIMGEREIKLVQQVVYYPESNRGVAWETGYKYANL